jgi:signal peptidase
MRHWRAARASKKVDTVDTGDAETPAPRSMVAALWSGVRAGILGLLVIIAVLVIGVPLVTGAQAYTITGRSMEPTLPVGTLIVTKPVPADEIRSGDIITYQMVSGNPTVATHRVVGFEFQDERRFVTQGDANSAVDSETVRPEQFRGRLWYSIPLLGWVNAVISGNMRGIVLFVVITLLFGYAAWMLIAAFRERSERQRAQKSAEN